ncbi:50S ribosomal protein L20 [Rickettsiales bacterium (ex Bugula neritina AB1)]|nr:50S ribosomal protein L20 [Rickettsiales bacterium (ex Bugula neritina AB1)]
MRIKSANSSQRTNYRKKILKYVKGFRNRRKNCKRIAMQAMENSLRDAYIGRKERKRNMKSLAIIRINAACRELNTNYSKFIGGLKQKNINISRKTLSEMAISDHECFMSLINAY